MPDAFLRAVLEYLLFTTPDIYDFWKIWWKIIVAGLSKFPCQLLASLQCFLFYILVTHSALNRGLFHKSANYAWSTLVKHWRNWLARQPKFSRDTKLTEEVLKETEQWAKSSIWYYMFTSCQWATGSAKRGLPCAEGSIWPQLFCSMEHKFLAPALICMKTSLWKKKKKDIPKDPKIFNSLFALALQFILIVNDLALGAKNLLTHPCLSTRQCAEIANFKIFYWHYKI